ncbi:MAG: hypothetical protein EHM72_18705, partial [Calditrichaeota bacterium]
MKKLLLLFLLLPFSINAQMVAGDAIPEFNDTFSCGSAPPDSTIHTSLIASSIPGNVLWPQEQVQLTLQFENTAARSIHIDGWLDILAYGTRGRPGDIWTPEMFKIADIGRVPFTIELAAGDFTNLSLQPHIPETFGAYGIVADCGQYGRRFITSCVRTFAAPDERLQYPSFCLDDNSPELLRRLGTHAIRIELNYKPTTDPDFEVWYERLRKRFLRYQQNNITVLVKISAPEPYGRLHPMGVTRPHLDDHGVMLNTKCDMAWLPQFDDDFKSFCYRIACDFGWPRGPINAFSLWNEPWEGLSISGWGADMLRYREIFVKMSEAIVAASEDAQVEILLGGGSSTSNALDKFFSEGTDDFLELYDFCSIHYQGMQSWATIKKWLYRSSERGRVRIWDTESWVANTDDRVAAVVAANKAAGYDRAMGIYGGNICQVNRRRMRTEQGLEQVETVDAWPVAASVGAVQHFIGERRFKELLFPNGLPWIMVFDGLASADDGCVVVVGDLGEEFGADNMLFRTVRGLAEINHKEQLQLELDRLDPQKEAGKIGELLRAMNQPEVLLGASLTLTSDDGRFLLYDFYGNPAPAKNGKITIPLDHRGFFLRTDGSAGSFAHLLEALRGAEIHGYEPFEMIAFDLSAPPSQHPTLHLKLTNMLNRPVSGRLKVQVEGLEITRPSRRLRFAPHETRQLFYRISNGNSSPDNIYPLELCFNAGTDGKAVHSEELHVNQISLRK